MDIQSYIASGKLELFLLGELNEREREEVLALASKYPEIQQELDTLEETLFSFDQKTGPVPSSRVKDKIFASLESEFKTAETPKARSSEAKVVSISPWKSFAAAASIVAVLASAAAIFFATRYYEKDQQFTALLQEQSVMADNLNQVKFEYEQKDVLVEKLVAGDFKRVQLKVGGLEIQKDAEVDVFWDKNAQEVFVAVNNLNELSDEYDYQLWAIGSTGPIGIGLVNSGQKLTLQQMNSVSDAGVFAITIEPKGGSQKPTLDKLVVIGDVA